MRDFSEIIRDLQNEEEFCDFTENELISLVQFVKDNQGERTENELFNKSSCNTRDINQEDCK